MGPFDGHKCVLECIYHSTTRIAIDQANCMSSVGIYEENKLLSETWLACRPFWPTSVSRNHLLTFFRPGNHLLTVSRKWHNGLGLVVPNKASQGTVRPILKMYAGCSTCSSWQFPTLQRFRIHSLVIRTNLACFAPYMLIRQENPRKREGHMITRDTFSWTFRISRKNTSKGDTANVTAKCYTRFSCAMPFIYCFFLIRLTLNLPSWSYQSSLQRIWKTERRVTFTWVAK
jgi:hypothetical protein